MSTSLGERANTPSPRSRIERGFGDRPADAADAGSPLAHTVAASLIATAALELSGATWPARPLAAAACGALATAVLAWRGDRPVPRAAREIAPELALFLIAAALAPPPWRVALAALALCATARLRGGRARGRGLAYAMLALRTVLLTAIVTMGTIEGIAILAPSFRPVRAGPLLLDLTQLGAFFGAPLAVAWFSIPILADRRVKRREVPRVVAAVALAAAARLAMVLLLAGRHDAGPLALERIMAPPLSMTLFTIVLAIVVARAPRRPVEHRAMPGIRFAAGFAALVAVMRFLLFFEEPGEPLTRRIVREDERGMRIVSGTTGMGATVDPSRLAPSDLLILTSAAASHTPAQTGALRSFVRRGGALLLVGGPAARPGAHASINRVARGFGIVFDEDVVGAPTDSSGHCYSAPGIARHPILEGIRSCRLPPSCSIVPLAPSIRTVIRTGGLRSARSDASGSPLAATCGPLVQLAARHWGTGRVAAAAMPLPLDPAAMEAGASGRDALARGVLEWLSRRNRFPDAYSFARLGVILLLLATPLLIAARPSWAGIVLALAAAANLAGTRLADETMRRGYPPDSGAVETCAVSTSARPRPPSAPVPRMH